MQKAHAHGVLQGGVQVREHGPDQLRPWPCTQPGRGFQAEGTFNSFHGSLLAPTAGCRAARLGSLAIRRRAAEGLGQDGLTQGLSALEVGIDLGLDAAGDGEAAVDFGDDAMLFGEGRHWDGYGLEITNAAHVRYGGASRTVEDEALESRRPEHDKEELGVHYRFVQAHPQQGLIDDTRFEPVRDARDAAQRHA
jgi:hypothetical protein